MYSYTEYVFLHHCSVEQGIKYNGERVGVALDPLPEGPYFKGVAKGGFGTDMSSAATLLDKKK